VTTIYIFLYVNSENLSLF
ncbi:unnamed protein product, partial [Rotaria sp. Silwood2]